MTRNMLADGYLTRPTEHFRNDPGYAVHSEDLRPIFESLGGYAQDDIRTRIATFDRTDVEGVADDLRVYESVAAGLIALLHPDA